MSIKSHKLNSEKGFTLIEIMISLLIGVFLIVGAIQLFINSKQTYRVQEALARLQESGRFALDFLDRDIRMAGYRGCASRGASEPINNYLTNKTAYPYDFDKSIQGFDAGVSTWTPSLPTMISGLSPAAGKDIITIRRAGEDSAQVSTATASQIGIIRNTVPALKACDVVMISNCSSTSVLQISSDYDNTNKKVNYTVGAGCSSSGTGGNANALTDTYAAGGNLNKALTTTYYIRNNANNQPTLFRLLNTNAEEELVEGVEDMQIYYGQDNDKDGTANIYVKAGSADPANTVSVRVSLLLRTIDNNIASRSIPYRFDDQDKTPNDKRIRRVFTSTIAIRNKLP